MEFEELSNTIFKEIKPKLENSQGLTIFARERAKFEGWLKVEVCDSLSKYFRDVVPELYTTERKWIDISFQNWVIQLKTVNTSYRYKNVEIKTRTITMNIQAVIDDIEYLKSKNFDNRAVLFVAFPATHDHEKWQDHYQKISSLLRRIKHVSFNFKNYVPGIIYFGLV